MKKLPLLAAVAVLALPGTAAAAHQSGVVVKTDLNAHLLVVAQRAGQVVRVHAPASRFARNGKRFRVGRRISFTARKLRNGTLAGSDFRITGHARRVTVHGIVRAYNARKQRLTLAAGGALLRMKLARTGARSLMASAPPPKAGDEVTVTASVDENDDALEATEVDADQAANDAQADENDDQQGDQDGQQAQDDSEQAEQDDQGAEADSGQAAESGNGSGDDTSSDDGSDGSGSGDEGGD